MTRRTLGTLQVVTAIRCGGCRRVLGAAAARRHRRRDARVGARGHRRNDGHRRERRDGRDGGPPGRGRPARAWRSPGRPRTGGTHGGTAGHAACSSRRLRACSTTESSTIAANLQSNIPMPTNDVTVTFNLTGSFVLKPLLVRDGANAFHLHAEHQRAGRGDRHVPLRRLLVFVSQFQLPFTATAEGTISSSISVTAAGVLQASDTRQIVVLKADSADLCIGAGPRFGLRRFRRRSHSSGSQRGAADGDGRPDDVQPHRSGDVQRGVDRHWGRSRRPAPSPGPAPRAPPTRCRVFNACGLHLLQRRRVPETYSSPPA